MKRWTDPFWRWLLCDPDARNIRLRRLSFWWYDGCLEGPVVSYTRRGESYEFASLVWSWARFRGLFRGISP